jgi:hypothetical protein
LREDCSAGSGYTHCYDLFFLLSHGQFVDSSVSQRGRGKSRIEASRLVTACERA